MRLARTLAFFYAQSMSSLAALPPQDIQRGKVGWALEGARQAMTGPAFMVALALVGVGSLARSAGFSIETAVASTILIWAAPGQVVFFGAVAAKASPAAVALAISLSSVRLLPMCLTILPLLRHNRPSLKVQVLASHFVAVTAWAECLHRLPKVPGYGRMAFFFGFANACLWVSTLTTAIGFELAGNLPIPLGAGLLFLPAIYFLGAMARNARIGADWLALGLGLVLAPVTEQWIGGGLDLLVLGLVGGTLAYLAGRFMDAAHAMKDRSAP